MKRDKRITTKDLFSFYPFKKNIKTTGKTIPQPYIKTKDLMEDDPNSIDYTQWVSVVNDYISIISDVLLTGREYEFPYYMGKFQLRKYKTKRLINWHETSKLGRKVYYKNNDSLHIILKWYRTYDNARFHFKHHWKIRMAKTFSRALHQKTLKNSNYVYNILDV